MGNKKVCAHVIVSGRVQGVAYRYYAKNIANQLGVTGWVKNLINGDVELIIEGLPDAVEKMILWCKKGPSLARVEDIKIEWLANWGEHSQFRIEY